MDHFLRYVANDTAENANNILEVMVPDYNSFDKLWHITDELGVVNILLRAMEQFQTKQCLFVVMLLCRLQ